MGLTILMMPISTIVVMTVSLGVTMIVMVLLVKDLRFLPAMALTGNSGEEESGGEQVESFHLRRV